MYRALLKALFISISPCLLVAANEELKPEYVAMDLAGTALIGRLVPLGSQTFESLNEVLSIFSSEDNGFGGRRFTMGKASGYTKLYIDGFAFNGELGRFRVGIEGSGPSWLLLREQVMKVWSGAGGPEYQCTDDGCFYENETARVIESYKAAVAARLGALAPVKFPANLKVHYRYLLSPFETTHVGLGGCGFPINPLQGREAIDALLSNKRTDLISNVLKGYNPGGRVYALMALDELLRRGVRLSEDTLTTMAKVRNLSVGISACVGDILNEGLTARQAIAFLRGDQAFFKK